MRRAGVHQGTGMQLADGEIIHEVIDRTGDSGVGSAQKNPAGEADGSAEGTVQGTGETSTGRETGCVAGRRGVLSMTPFWV